MTQMPPPPPGIDLGGSGFSRTTAPDPVFLMSRSWVADHLSNAAVAFLARASAATVGAQVPVTDDVIAELSAAGLYVDGDLRDPALAGRLSSSRIAPIMPNPSVVYYARRPSDRAIKIGWSTDLDARRRRLAEVYGGVDLLATEPGGWHLEQERHQQFARLRLPRQRELEGGSEWFRDAPALLRHIDALVVSE